MGEDKLEFVRSSGNLYRDLGYPDADTLQMKAHLAAEIIATLNYRKLSVHAAGKLVGEGSSEISKIRNADLEQFTPDRLNRILTKIGEE